MKQAFVIGVDIGGSHITAAVADTYNKRILPHTLVRHKVNSSADSNTILEQWQIAVNGCQALHAGAVSCIGMAVPGPMDYDTGISYIRGQQKYDALYGMNLKTELAARLGMPASAIFMANDAACFMQGEADYGAGRGYRHILALTLGTGMGSARYTPSGAVDASLWNSPYREGIAEDYFSTRWFVNEYKKLTGLEVADVHSLVQKAETDIELAGIFGTFGRNLADFLNRQLDCDGTECIILGGNIAKSFSLFRQQLLACFRAADIPVKIALLGEEAALLGAASMAGMAAAFATGTTA